MGPTCRELIIKAERWCRQFANPFGKIGLRRSRATIFIALFFLILLFVFSAANESISQSITFSWLMAISLFHALEFATTMSISVPSERHDCSTKRTVEDNWAFQLRFAILFGYFVINSLFMIFDCSWLLTLLLTALHFAFLLTALGLGSSPPNQ